MKVTDERMEQALELLATTSQEYGELIGHSEWIEQKLSIVRADEFLNAEGSSVAEREARARVSQAYKTLVEEYKVAVTKKEILKARRASAEICIEIWRSLNATKRAANV